MLSEAARGRPGRDDLCPQPSKTVGLGSIPVAFDLGNALELQTLVCDLGSLVVIVHG